MIQVLDRAGARIADGLRQAHGRQLHLPKDSWIRNGRRRLLEDLLEAPLCATITAIQRDGLAVLVADDLHF